MHIKTRADKDLTLETRYSATPPKYITQLRYLGKHSVPMSCSQISTRRLISLCVLPRRAMECQVQLAPVWKRHASSRSLILNVGKNSSQSGNQYVSIRSMRQCRRVTAIGYYVSALGRLQLSQHSIWCSIVGCLVPPFHLFLHRGSPCMSHRSDCGQGICMACLPDFLS